MLTCKPSWQMREQTLCAEQLYRVVPDLLAGFLLQDGYQKKYFVLDTFEDGARKLREFCATITPPDVMERFMGTGSTSAASAGANGAQHH